MGSVRRFAGPFAVALFCSVFAPAAALAADVTRPAEVTGVLANRSDQDVVLSWDPVTTDAAGNPETAASYRVYRGTTPDFVPDRSGGSNRIGSVAGPAFTDAGAGAVAVPYFYLLTAVDGTGNESGAKPSSITTLPVLSGSYTDTTIELTWTPAAPAADVAGYRVYYGKASRRYDFFKDVGSATSTSLTGLETYVNWYSAVVAIDTNGNESAFSNEHVDAVAGRVRVRAHDDDYLCWGAGGCPPKPGQVQRNDGWQLMVPTDFPVGDWKRVLVTFTIDSRLCKNGQNGTTDKCGSTNPGGYNPCGDPWDRIANLFLVLDDCIAAGTSCITPQNLELMRAITPFGTDAPAPKGDGVVPPRRLTLDVTPFVPLLTGRRYVGVEIGHYVQAGWHVTVDFEFSKRPDEASAKKPAAGIEVVAFSGAPIPTKTVTVPSGATKVMMRLFTTGHGGTSYCDGGSNNGGACTSGASCPGGSCQNCDEFCHRTNQILRNGSVIYSVVPWRGDCGTEGGKLCPTWNACGTLSCFGSRAGWCPGKIACTSAAPCDQDLDMTTQLAPGGTYNIDYQVLVQRGSWLVSLALYWYTD